VGSGLPWVQTPPARAGHTHVQLRGGFDKAVVGPSGLLTRLGGLRLDAPGGHTDGQARVQSGQGWMRGVCVWGGGRGGGGGRTERGRGKEHEAKPDEGGTHLSTAASCSSMVLSIRSRRRFTFRKDL
jgi:hypothetical protein